MLLFLIPARGGSKGFPGKNVAMLAGIPLVGRAARTARKAALALGGEWRVVCSTDDPVIAEAARAWGAEVPFMRPAALATDVARSWDVVSHALEALGQEFEAVVLLQATSPLTKPEDVLEALDLHRRTGQPVVSICVAEHPVEWHFRMDEDQRLAPFVGLDKVNSAYQRQQTIPWYRPNGAVYVASPAQIRSGGFWTSETRGFAMPAERSVDIDAPSDLAVARTLLEIRERLFFEIAGRRVGSDNPCFIIAEAGVNHNGSLELAIRLVDAAADAGADAVKFQTFKAERLASADAPKAEYQLRATGNAESQLDMLRRLELSEDAHRAVLARCRQLGIVFLSSPFDEETADFLETLGVPAFKIPSGELTNLPFLAHVARMGRPMIVSTGMSTLAEVEAAVATAQEHGATALILLHCVSNYPACPQDVNLRAMATMREAFGLPIGYSDHTEGDEIALAAVALGACVLEKHFTIDRGLPGPDHRASIEPKELEALIRRVRDVEAALGDGQKVPAASEMNTALVARKSLVAAQEIEAGTTLTSEMVCARRPGTGIPVSRFAEVVGRTAVVSIPIGTILGWEMLR